MATHLSPRQPFAALDSPRLSSLANVKNRQNALMSAQPQDKPVLPVLSPSTKRRASSLFDDSHEDCENLDPSIFKSPSKKVKAVDSFTPIKPSSFVLKPSSTPRSARPAPIHSNSSNSITPLSSQRKAASQPSSNIKSTPISLRGGGSPIKHKRVGALKPKRRVSSSPSYARVDPPTSRNTLPFSLDAALSGTMPHSTSPPPTKNIVNEPEPVEPFEPVSLEESMPNSWFFEIHEDSPEEEATNMMEHSACTLDISSDDDAEDKEANEMREKGKENIPPPEYLARMSARSSNYSDDISFDDIFTDTSSTTSGRDKLRAKLDSEAMMEDRKPLGELVPEDYYGDDIESVQDAQCGLSEMSEKSDIDDNEWVQHDDDQDHSVKPPTADFRPIVPALDKGKQAASEAPEEAKEADEKPKEEIVVFEDEAQ